MASGLWKREDIDAAAGVPGPSPFGETRESRRSCVILARRRDARDRIAGRRSGYAGRRACKAILAPREDLRGRPHVQPWRAPRWRGGAVGRWRDRDWCASWTTTG